MKDATKNPLQTKKPIEKEKGKTKEHPWRQFKSGWLNSQNSSKIIPYKIKDRC